MIKQSKQVNKMGTKKQTNKVSKPKKTEKKEEEPEKLIWECLCCRFRLIATEKPTECACSHANYVINTQYKVGE